MNAAIYARKSTKQPGVADDAKSVTRQIENAQKFAAQRGWTVPEAYVFSDDGISGAEFEKRPGFMQMMSLLKPKAPFQFLIVSEQKSLGRETFETQYAIKRLSKAGVEIFEYLHGRSLTPKNWIEKTMSAVQSGADEAHREATRERVIETHTRLATQGYVTGGRVFGYRNHDVFVGKDAHGRPLRSHVERVVYEPEAAVVRRIFELYDAGFGLKRIARRLIAEHAVEPTPFVRKDGLTHDGWSPITIRSILHRELYHGTLVWNRSRKRDEWGEKYGKQRRRPRSEWVRTEVESLRIIPEELWLRCVSRRAESEQRTLRFASGRLCGRPPETPSQNLLAGLAQCGVCGGGIGVETSPRIRGRVSEYMCRRHRNLNTCPNALRISTATLNEAVLQAIEEHVLSPEAFDQMVAVAERDDYTEQRERLLEQQADVAKRLTRLGRAIETGGRAETLVARIRELETRRAQLAEEIAHLRPVPRLDPEVVENRLAEWRRSLRGSTTQGRSVLQRVILGRVTLTPVGGAYEFTATTRYAKLFTGIASPRPTYLRDGDVRGTEHLTPNDTFDADYGELLDRAIERKGLASPMGFEPMFRP